MEALTEAELEFFQWYRTLCDKEKLAVRWYVHQGDPRLLPAFGEHRERIDRLRRLASAKGDQKGTLFGT